MTELKWKNNQPDFAEYLTAKYGSKLGTCPDLVITNRCPNATFMTYLRKCLAISLDLNAEDTTFKTLKPKLDDLCKVLYEPYQAPCVTLFRIAFYAKTISNDANISDTYDYWFGSNLSEVQNCLGIGSTNGFWASQTYALFSDYALYKNPAIGDNELINLAHDYNSYFTQYQNYMDQNYITFMRTDGVLELKDYVPRIVNRLRCNLNQSVNYQVKETDLLEKHYDDYKRVISSLLFLQGASSNELYENYDSLKDDLGFFDNDYYLNKTPDSPDKVSLETFNFLTSNKYLSNVYSTLLLKLNLQSMLRDRLHDNSIDLEYGQSISVDSNKFSLIKKYLPNAVSIDFGIWNGKQAKEAYGADETTNSAFTEASTTITNGKIDNVSLKNSDQNYAANLSLSKATKLVESMDIDQGKVKTQLSFDNDKNLSWNYFIWIEKLHGKKISMPIVVKYGITIPMNNLFLSIVPQTVKIMDPLLVNELAPNAKKLAKRANDFINSLPSDVFAGTNGLQNIQITNLSAATLLELMIILFVISLGVFIFK